jgi:hypothetical protein
VGAALGTNTRCMQRSKPSMDGGVMLLALAERQQQHKRQALRSGIDLTCSSEVETLFFEESAMDKENKRKGKELKLSASNFHDIHCCGNCLFWNKNESDPEMGECRRLPRVGAAVRAT